MIYELRILYTHVRLKNLKKRERETRCSRVVIFAEVCVCVRILKIFGCKNIRLHVFYKLKNFIFTSTMTLCYIIYMFIDYVHMYIIYLI